MAQIVLDRACIVPIAGELVAGAVPQQRKNSDLKRASLGKKGRLDARGARGICAILPQ